ncbi:sulfatase-like hydrolase/transferase [Larkinella sp. C7]|jgi:arylsulfatase A-like enzyme|uniref:sulfatase-like hydrolase/transferase n=1 Tax=Larkinella sp. C7 TaxID=2576607 RepID=UPI0011112156|nr:sulfatase-like hydrolase/transferase [Larkinella sp. C7]
MRKYVNRLLLVLLSGFLYPVFGQKKPMNVLVLYSDDQRYNTIHTLGNDAILTPNLDRLVKKGVAFTRAQTMGGLHGALCAPSRAMLHTGRYLHSLHKTGDVIPKEHTTLPEYLRTKGYQTYAIGKWHNDKASFSRSYEGGAALFFGGMHLPEKGGQEHPQYVNFDPSGQFKEPTKKADVYSSELYANEAIAFLNNQKPENRPFYCYVAFTSPHDPRTPPEAFRKLYPKDRMKLPANFLPQHPFDNGELNVRDEKLLPRPLTEEQAKEELALYYGMISELDAQVGRILDVLEKNGLLETTLIVFAGDNGLAVGSHGLLGKQNLYEHSMRVPLIMSHPALPQNRRVDALAYLADIFPTVTDFLGLPVPATVESQTLLPFINGTKKPGRASVYYAYRDFQRAVRTHDNWKLIKYNVNRQETTQLFDLNKDPYEVHNLANNPVFAKKKKLLENRLISEMQTYHDFLDLSQPDWGKQP